MNVIYRKARFSLALLCFVFLSSLPLSAQQEKLYHNEDGHFSFEVPEGWDRVPDEIVRQHEAAIKQATGRDMRYDCVFQKKSDYYLTHPFFQVMIDKKGRYDEEKMAKDLKTESARKEMNKAKDAVENAASDYVKSVNFGTFTHDPENHIFYLKTKVRSPEGENFLSISAIILSNYGTVRLLFHSKEDDFNQNLAYFEEVISSFKFDPDYGY